MDGTVVRAHQKAAGAKGAAPTRSGAPAGGFGAKACAAACDASGRPLAFAAPG